MPSFFFFRVFFFVRDENGNLTGFSVVGEDGVYRGDRTCVEKPASKKRLSERDHLSKVRNAVPGSNNIGRFVPACYMW